MEISTLTNTRIKIARDVATGDLTPELGYQYLLEAIDQYEEEGSTRDYCKQVISDLCVYGEDLLIEISKRKLEILNGK